MPRCSGITITGPYGHQTDLTLDSAGYLQQFSGPEGQDHEFTYFAGGLLATQTDPRDNTSSYSYDADGRVSEVLDRASRSWRWDRSTVGSSYTVTDSTPEHRVTVRTVARNADGSKAVTTTDPAGLVTVETTEPRGFVTRELPDSTVVTTTAGASFPVDVSVERTDTTTVTLPSSLASTLITTRQRILESEGSALSVQRMEETVRRQGARGAWQTITDFDSAFVRTESPEGRLARDSLDARGRVIATRLERRTTGCLHATRHMMRCATFSCLKRATGASQAVS